MIVINTNSATPIKTTFQIGTGWSPRTSPSLRILTHPASPSTVETRTKRISTPSWPDISIRFVWYFLSLSCNWFLSPPLPVPTAVHRSLKVEIFFRCIDIFKTSRYIQTNKLDTNFTLPRNRRQSLPSLRVIIEIYLRVFLRCYLHSPSGAPPSHDVSSVLGSSKVVSELYREAAAWSAVTSPPVHQYCACYHHTQTHSEQCKL